MQILTSKGYPEIPKKLPLDLLFDLSSMTQQVPDMVRKEV